MRGSGADSGKLRGTADSGCRYADGAVSAFAKPFLLTFGASRNTIGFAMDYIRIYACGTIFVQLTLV